MNCSYPIITAIYISSATNYFIEQNAMVFFLQKKIYKKLLIYNNYINLICIVEYFRFTHGACQETSVLYSIEDPRCYWTTQHQCKKRPFSKTGYWQMPVWFGTIFPYIYSRRNPPESGDRVHLRRWLRR